MIEIDGKKQEMAMSVRAGNRGEGQLRGMRNKQIILEVPSPQDYCHTLNQ